MKGNKRYYNDSESESESEDSESSDTSSSDSDSGSESEESKRMSIKKVPKRYFLDVIDSHKLTGGVIKSSRQLELDRQKNTKQSYPSTMVMSQSSSRKLEESMQSNQGKYTPAITRSKQYVGDPVLQAFKILSNQIISKSKTSEPTTQDVDNDNNNDNSSLENHNYYDNGDNDSEDDNIDNGDNDNENNGSEGNISSNIQVGDNSNRMRSNPLESNTTSTTTTTTAPVNNTKSLIDRFLSIQKMNTESMIMKLMEMNRCNNIRRFIEETNNLFNHDYIDEQKKILSYIVNILNKSSK